jgi:hypothetical protein
MEGVFFDARTVIVAMAGLFGGVPAAVVSAVIAAGYRAWLGGLGTTMGIGTLLTAAVAGVAFHALHRAGAVKITAINLALFGLAVQAIADAGANTGARARILVHRASDAGALIELDPAPAAPVEAGDAARLTAGCDKQFNTCRVKFQNGDNFRGCPHMPGDDLLIRHASSEAVRDGGAR